uniref:Uncharacterized protein n=1 Tax=Glossina pallidipes TaxID=7398 RepID=A0A1A9ZAH9_GLOPL
MNWPTVRLQWRCCWWQFTSLTIFMLTILMSCISGGRKSIANAQELNPIYGTELQLGRSSINLSAISMINKPQTIANICRDTSLISRLKREIKNDVSGSLCKSWLLFNDTCPFTIAEN